MQTLSNAAEIDRIAEEFALARLFDDTLMFLEGGCITAGVHRLFDGLDEIRNRMEPDAWRALAGRAREDRRIGAFVYQDPFTYRAFCKPRGYAGDALMMDYVYDIHGGREVIAQASAIGAGICRTIQSRTAGQSVRRRRERLAQLIDESADARPQPHVLAVAAGHLREAELSRALASGRVGRLVALDADAESLREVATRYAAFSVDTVHASVRHLLARKLDLGRFDLVYAAGLYDYLNDSTAAALTARLLELTNPGGRLVVPNFAPCCADRGYMESFMAWDLVYRDEFDLSNLVNRMPSDDVAGYDITRDTTGAIVYLTIEKSSGAAVA